MYTYCKYGSSPLVAMYSRNLAVTFVRGFKSRCICFWKFMANRLANPNHQAPPKVTLIHQLTHLEIQQFLQLCPVPPAMPHARQLEQICHLCSHLRRHLGQLVLRHHRRLHKRKSPPTRQREACPLSCSSCTAVPTHTAPTSIHTTPSLPSRFARLRSGLRSLGEQGPLPRFEKVPVRRGTHLRPPPNTPTYRNSSNSSRRSGFQEL